MTVKAIAVTTQHLIERHIFKDHDQIVKYLGVPPEALNEHGEVTEFVDKKFRQWTVVNEFPMEVVIDHTKTVTVKVVIG